MIARIFVGMMFIPWIMLSVQPAGNARPYLQPEEVVYIFTPLPGQALQGVIPVEVSLIVPELEVAYLEFRYVNHPLENWFLITQVSVSIPDGQMALWDTSTITDGEYDLRLRAVTRDQRQLEYRVDGLRVRNYSVVETETPTPVIPTETLLPGQATPTLPPTQTPLPPTATPMATNPAILTFDQVSQTMAAGSLVVLVLFLAVGVYVFFRSRASGRF